jgi:hypothetical protein
MTLFPFVEGFMPLQLLLELAAIVVFLSGASWFVERAGWRVGRLVKAVAIFLTVFIWLTYRIYPPVPFSVRLMYLTVTLAAILLWASSSEVYWQEFRRPIAEMLDGETVGMKLVRGIAPAKEARAPHTALQPI